ncbi:protease complex subunit PrcB family protein [Marinobacter sp. 1_MG-2023]|uniref:protease complex subunit PrcB family protein n=1 Tax=Marinobacter sp. 1_MG-2023 TaxID=3062627 RepID=UPI0026E1A84B|nr:protease complex subunit PrcB family protein [Marinobacter sp. 1_MG-2023]MDO6823170.1 protease complex subunit PrcB family protein [Marinobacter sp. 1_MG-2023]
MLTGLPAVSLVAAGALLVGCAATETAEDEPRAPLVRQVTQSAHCGLTGPGLAYVQTKERLQQLLELPTQNMAVQQLREVDLEQEHLLFVTLGQKPTGGHSLSLASAEVESSDNMLRLTMVVRAPAPGSMAAQVITSPCAVIAIPVGDWSEIRVSGVRDADLVEKF